MSAVVSHASLTFAYRFARPVEQARADTTPAVAPKHRPRRRRRIAAGIAAAVVAGGGIAAAVVASQSQQPIGRTVTIAPYDIGTRSARLTICASTPKIGASKLRKVSPSQVYEVGLTDNARKNFAAIGTLSTDNTATLTVTPPSARTTRTSR